MTETYREYGARMSAAGVPFLCETAWNEKYLGIPPLEWPPKPLGRPADE
jgi:hypothetical protein